MKLYRSTHRHPAWNLAAEEYLLQSGQEALFLYTNDASVIVGCNQAIEREVDTHFCKQNNIALCRRISGGGAVYHDLGNLNFCFVGERNARSLSHDFLQPIVEMLQMLGLQAAIGVRKDLWIGDKKITGTASHFAQNRCLQHGTLLYDSNLAQLHAALGLMILPDGQVQLSPQKQALSLRGVHSRPSPVGNLRSFLQEDMDATAFFDTFAKLSCAYFQVESDIFSEEQEREITILAQEKYQTQAWIFKR